MRILEGFQFERKNTVIHRLDPRVKLFYSILMFILSMVFWSPPMLMLLFISILPMFYFAKVTRRLVRTIQGSIFLLAIIFLINYFATGLERALAMSLRFLVIIASFSIFFLTTYPEDLSEALIKLGIPYEFALTFVMSIRFVPCLAREAQLIIDAQRARGLELDKGSFIKRLRNYVPILVPLIVNSIRRSIRVAEAMESRAFGASSRRTSLVELKLKRSDYLFMIFALTMFLVLLLLKVFGVEQVIAGLFKEILTILL